MEKLTKNDKKDNRNEEKKDTRNEEKKQKIIKSPSKQDLDKKKSPPSSKSPTVVNSMRSSSPNTPNNNNPPNPRVKKMSYADVVQANLRPAELALLNKQMGGVDTGSLGRTRSESVSDVDVKILLSNLQQVSESESEDVVSTSETESDFLESEFEKYFSSQTESPTTGRPRSRSRDFWNKLTHDLSKQAQEQMLAQTPEGLKETMSAPATAMTQTKKAHGGGHTRNRSWTEAKETMATLLDSSLSSSSNSTQEGVSTDPISRRTHNFSSHSFPPIEEKAESSSNWWASLKSQLDQETSPDYQELNPATPEIRVERTDSNVSEGSTAPPNEGGFLSWWSSMKNQLDHELTGAPLSPVSSEQTPTETVIEESQESSSSSWWASLKSDLDQQQTGKPGDTVDRSRASTNSSQNSNSSVVTAPPGSPKSPSKKKKSTLPRRAVLLLDDGEYQGETSVNEENYSVAHGWGTFRAKNSELYVGHWVNGKRQGKGIKTWEDGREYCGTWENNKRNGYGTLSWTDGTLYTGEIRYGFYQGYGTLRYADGSKYVGEFNVNEKHGQGMMCFSNGDVYYGEWKQGKMEGFGVYRKANGEIQQGIFDDNKFTHSTKKPPKEKEKEIGSVKANKKKTFSLGTRHRTISESFLKK